MSMVTVPMVCIVIMYSVPIIDSVLNSSFRPGALSLQILALYTLVSTIMVPYYYVVLGMNRPKSSAKIYIAAGAVNIALNLALIPRDGLLSGFGISGPAGAATAALAFMCVMLVGSYFYSSRLIGRKLAETRILTHLLAGAVSCLAMYWLGGIPEIFRAYHLALFSIAGLGIYISVLWALGEFRRKEIMFFLGIINPRKLLGQVRDDMNGGPKAD
jgi:O-antigen/teichoic acid export membrane protein